MTQGPVQTTVTGVCRERESNWGVGGLRSAARYPLRYRSSPPPPHTHTHASTRACTHVHTKTLNSSNCRGLHATDCAAATTPATPNRRRWWCAWAIAPLRWFMHIAPRHRRDFYRTQIEDSVRGRDRDGGVYLIDVGRACDWTTLGVGSMIG